MNEVHSSIGVRSITKCLHLPHQKVYVNKTEKSSSKSIIGKYNAITLCNVKYLSIEPLWQLGLSLRSGGMHPAIYCFNEGLLRLEVI